MKKIVALILAIALLFSITLNLYAVTDDYASMNSATSIGTGSTSHYFSGGGSDYQAWFRFRPTETNYYNVSVSSNAYLNLKLYTSSHSMIDSEYGYDATIGTMMYAYNDYYIWVDSGERYSGHYIYVSVQKENHDISSSSFSIYFDEGDKYYYQEGNAICPNVTVSGNGRVLRLNSDYTVSYKNNKSVGTGTATITGIGNYSGTVSKNFTIVSHTHSWGTGTVVTVATCKNTGVKKYTCSTCKATKSETIPKTTTHNYTENVYSSYLKSEATCISPAIYYKSCSVCGTTNYNSTFTSGSADSTKHSYDNACDTTCNICGSYRTVTHAYESAWSSDGVQHWHACSVCNGKSDIGSCYGGKATCEIRAKCEICKKAYGSFAEHNYVEKVGEKFLKTAASCKTKAVYYKSCEICQAIKYTDTFESGDFDPTKHVNGTYLINQKDADCKNKGYSGDEMCKDCDVLVKLGQETDFGVHTYVHTYDINCSVCGEKRSATFLEWKISVNESGVYTLNPSSAYTGEFNTKDIIVLDKNGNEVKCNEIKSGFPFIGDCDYIVKFKYDCRDYINGTISWNKIKQADKIFPDTDKNGWYNDAVTYAVGAGIMSGYSNGKFGTSDSIQRQDFLVMLARYEGVNLDNYSKKSKFSDVARGGYYEAAVNWGAEMGIVTGYDNGKFGVGDKVTREQLVTFLYRYAKYKGVNTTCTTAEKDKVKNTYSDYKNVSYFAQNAVIWAVTNGVIGGKTPTTIAPQGNAQRCEVAKIMYNIFLNDIFKN